MALVVGDWFTAQRDSSAMLHDRVFDDENEGVFLREPARRREFVDLGRENGVCCRGKYHLAQIFGCG